MSKPAAVPRTREWLNGAERARLHEHEATLERGARHDILRGNALADIRDSRLYRESHATFEAYCLQPRWRLSRSRAYQLIAFAGVVAAVSTVDRPGPATEAVARELAPLSEQPEAMAEAWSKAVDRHGPQPTAEQVRAIRAPGRPDTRFGNIEDANASLRLLPAADRIVWPVQPGDVDAIDAEVKELAARAKAIAASWSRHKRDLRGMRSAG